MARPLTEQETFVAYAVGLCYASVCTTLPADQAAARLNLEHPTGVTPWKVADEPFRTGETNPHPCENGLGQHWLFVC